MAGDPNGSRAQQATYYEQYIAKLPGTYTGTDPNLAGKTWVQVYRWFLQHYPQKSPKDLGDAVVGLWALETEASRITTEAGALGPFSKIAESSAAQTNFNPLTSVAEALAGVGGGIAAFYHAITDGKMWRSLGWLVMGAVLIGLALFLWFKSDIAKSLPPVTPVPL